MLKKLNMIYGLFIVFILEINTTFSNCTFGLCRVDNNLKGTENTNIVYSVNSVMIYLLSFLGLITMILFLWAGFNIMTAGGDDDKVKKGKKTMIYSLVGIIIIFSAYQIVTFTFGAVK